jgi:hypothetical protein
MSSSRWSENVVKSLVYNLAALLFKEYGAFAMQMWTGFTISLKMNRDSG